MVLNWFPAEVCLYFLTMTMMIPVSLGLGVDSFFLLKQSTPNDSGLCHRLLVHPQSCQWKHIMQRCECFTCLVDVITALPLVPSGITRHSRRSVHGHLRNRFGQLNNARAVLNREHFITITCPDLPARLPGRSES